MILMLTIHMFSTGISVLDFITIIAANRVRHLSVVSYFKLFGENLWGALRRKLLRVVLQAKKALRVHAWILILLP